ncbi:hypothetical protein CI102_6054 [Trichoderma harzianum]|nr:hypothetical protein CI102_6054 [Trichoderma harzianum]
MELPQDILVLFLLLLLSPLRSCSCSYSSTTCVCSLYLILSTEHTRFPQSISIHSSPANPIEDTWTNTHHNVPEHHFGGPRILLQRIQGLQTP